VISKGCLHDAVTCTGKLIKNTAENRMWAESRKYNMGQKQKLHADQNAENTSGT